MNKSVAPLSIGRYIYRPIADTPFFPDWRHRLAPMGSRTAQAVARVRSYTLCQLETCFASWGARRAFPQGGRQAKQPRPRLHPLAHFLVHALAGSEPRGFRLGGRPPTPSLVPA